MNKKTASLHEISVTLQDLIGIVLSSMAIPAPDMNKMYKLADLERLENNNILFHCITEKEIIFPHDITEKEIPNQSKIVDERRISLSPSYMETLMTEEAIKQYTLTGKIDPNSKKWNKINISKENGEEIIFTFTLSEGPQ